MLKNNIVKKHKIIQKNKCIIAFVLLFSICIQNISFAVSTSSIIRMTKNYEHIGPSINIYPDTDVAPNTKYIQKQLMKNIGSQKIQAIEDNVLLLGSTLSTAAQNNIKDVLEPYCEDDTNLVMAYYIGSPYKKLLGRFYLQNDLTYEYSQIKGLTSETLSDNEIDFYSPRLEKVRDFFPEDYLEKFPMIIFDSDGLGNDLISIYPLDIYGKEYGMTVDINDIYKEPTFQRTWLRCFTEYLLKNESQRIKEDEEENEISQNIHDKKINIKKGKQEKNEKYFEYDGIKYKESSYIHLFFKNFWVNEEKRKETFEENIKNKEEKKNIYTINERGNKITDKEEKNNLGGNTGLVYKYKDSDFVSEKASANIEEDFYETFKVFILKEKPAANYLKDRKVLFMYQFPELVKIRENLKTKLIKIKN